ncbi:MAG: diol dehydratase small subunit [Clostridia bacterium]|nr:diol dehydratase small subunit [Clostridia bacterium]
MNQSQLIEQIVRDVLVSLEKGCTQNSFPVKEETNSCDIGAKVTKEDYPLGEKRVEILKTPTGKAFDTINLSSVIEGQIGAEDLRISPETLEMQAQIGESVGRDAFARNLRRAAELISVPDQRILEIYNAIRPYRSTKEEILEIADELENKYNAKINAAFVREAAEVYEKRNRLKRV